MRAKEFLILEATSDPEIVKTQEKLRDLGYDLGPYGPKGDGVDGIVGPYTQAAMNAYTKGLDPKNVQKPDPLAIQDFENDHPVTRSIKRKKSKSTMQLPVDGPVSSPFGHRTSVGSAQNHNGTDFAVPTGTEVVAPEAGVITGAGTGSGGEGNYVILNANGMVHKFFHLSKILVQNNDQVTAGEVIALSGNTGHSTGPHLHWETHLAGTPVDPMRNVA
jgi:murein DD-endopeptidase MepM/ murein hydrolase activator NlpD